MKNTEKELIQRWVTTWQRAEQALKDIKKEELRFYDYAQNFPIIDDMLQWAYEHRTTRRSSGLIEQQRWFMKMRKDSRIQETTENTA